jgi:hypothetical protein
MRSNPSRCFDENVPPPQKTPFVFYWDFNAATLPPLAEFLSPKNGSSDIRTFSRFEIFSLTYFRPLVFLILRVLRFHRVKQL